MNNTVEISLTAELFNPIYAGFMFDETRFFHLWGGAGSGKSVAAAQKIVYRMLNDTGFRCLVIRKIGNSLRHSCFAEISNVIAQWGIGHLFNIRRGLLEIECLLNGNACIFKGVDDPEKLKSISGISSMWIEEATELRLADFMELNRRLRGYTDCYKQIILSYNPINYYHWLNQEIHIKGTFGNRTRLIHSTWRDNEFLDPETIREYREQSLISKIAGDVYDLGKWAIPEHVVYSAYRLADEREPFTPITEAYGIDFGINSPLAVVHVRWREMRSVHVSEVLYDTGVNDSRLHELLNTEIPRGKRSIPIYCDSAEPNRIEELRLVGFNALPANKSVTDGIRYCQNNRLTIDPNSPNLERELSLYEFQEVRGQILDIPVKLQDHALDAMRYAMYTHGKQYIIPREGAGQSTHHLPNSKSIGTDKQTERRLRRRGRLSDRGF